MSELPADHPLSIASQQRDVDGLRNAVWALEQDWPTSSLLTELLLQDWHDSHEDIVFEIGLIGDPRAVDAIKASAISPFAYLEEWGNKHEFQRKCAYALARIGTVESRSALEELAQSEDEHIREYGEEGLEHWPMPYEKN